MFCNKLINSLLSRSNKCTQLFVCAQERIYKNHFKQKSIKQFSTQTLDFKLSLNINIQKRDYAKRQMNRPTKKGQSAFQTQLNSEDLNSVIDFDKMKQQMDNAISQLKEELTSQLQLKITLASLQALKVDTSDGKQILGEIALLQQKSAQLITVDLTDSPQFVNDVKNAIIKSGFNVTPQIEGVTLYLPIQKVTKDHREKLAKNAKMMCDLTNEKLRNIQSTFDRKLKSNEKTFSEDLIRNLREAIYAETRACISDIDDILEKKQKELLNN